MLLKKSLHIMIYSYSFRCCKIGNNEVGLWNLESRYRQKVLTTLNASNHSISALYPLQSVDSHSHVSTNILTAGTDMRVRFWDLQQPSNSEIVSFAANEIVERSTISYRLDFNTERLASDWESYEIQNACQYFYILTFQQKTG